MEKLLRLRKEVKKIDNEILRLIRRRFNITCIIGKEKKKLGLPLKDWSVEKGVIENARNYAKVIGIDEQFATEVISKIVEQSRIQQERNHYSGYSGTPEDVLIIGGLGAMGRWFAYFLQNQGHRVSIFDVKPTRLKGFKYYKNLEDAIASKSVVFIATPLSIVPRTIETLVDLNCRAVICDIASIKIHLIPAIEKAIKKGLKITSIHPMFGPGCHTLVDKVICLCSCNNEKADSKIKNFFKDTAVNIISLSFDEHDRLISYILGLSHFINILFIKVLMDSGYEFKVLKEVASTTFKSQMATTLSVINENPELYYEIQALNKWNNNLYNSLKNTLDQLISLISKRKREDFKEIFIKSQGWVDAYQD
uniref:Prephenate dehydrogenase/arogenate dehydrogenase family protein n=1 Tax=candidate division WOR-3 bacterium TaxID=2052148 RepID=A0A7V3RGT8_UNCW3